VTLNPSDRHDKKERAGGAPVMPVGSAGLSGIVPKIIHGLRYYPYYITIRTPRDVDDDDFLKELGTRIAKFGQAADGRHAIEPKLSFTRVRIDRDQAASQDSVTRYSRTHLPLAPHTDSSYMEVPHELVAFQCVVADAVGGETQMVPVDDILRQLSDTDVSLLSETVYPFGDGDRAILGGSTHAPTIRYYDAQLSRTLEELGSGAGGLKKRYRKALKRLNKVLEQSDLGETFALASGDILLMNNARVLHGRSGFAEESERMIFRLRVHAPSLTAEENRKPSKLQKPQEPPKPREGTVVRLASSNHAAFDRGRAEELAQNDRFDEAIRLCKDHLRRVPDDFDASVTLARFYEDDGQFKNAADQYRAACELKPDDPKLLEILGDLLLMTGEFEEAESVYRRCRELDPDAYNVALALSSILREDGRMDEARALLGDAARKHPFVFWSKPKKDRPTLLRARGMTRATYGIIQDSDGDYVSLLQGGHFSVKHLLDHRDYNLLIANIVHDSLDHAEVELPFDLILNTISCADLEGESLLSLARFLDRYPEKPVINHPRQVYNTTRDRNYQRLGHLDGVVFPQTERVFWGGGNPETFIRQVHGLGFDWPMIVRATGSQTGLSVILAQEPSELHDYLEAAPAGHEYYVIQYHDVQQRPGIFNKSRIFCIDGHYYPVANLFVDDWTVHSGDRYAIMDKTPWTQDEERAYLEDHVTYLGPKAFNTLLKIRDIVQLDFFGIDYTRLPDGSLFIFELNPAMRHNYDHADNFPYTRPHLDRISAAFDDMVAKRIRQA